MANSSLQAIQTKVRRLTRSPSEAQLSDADLNQYINTFVLYDFPEQIRTWNLKQTFTFVCNAFQDRYPVDSAGFGAASDASSNLLYNFQNIYLTLNPPVYIAGFQSFYTQSREQFFGIYPKINSIASIGIAGNGITTNFSGIINSQQSQPPAGVNQLIVLLRNNVLFSSVDSNNNSVSLADVPVLDATTGNPTPYGNLYDPNSAAYKAALANPPLAAAPYTPGAATNPFANNYINYVTGQFNITFTTAPASGVPINSQSVPQNASLPQAMLYYDNEIVLRPVPDQSYRIQFEVFIRPTELLNEGQSPDLEEWWQYISYGAARKILQDRMDIDTVALIEPEFKRQEALCLRRTYVQLANQRTATIYTEQTGTSSGWGYGGGQF